MKSKSRANARPLKKSANNLGGRITTMNKFELPDNAYPDNFQVLVDGEIAEFKSISDDLLRYVNGATEADLDKLRALGINSILSAIIAIADKRLYPKIFLQKAKNDLVQSLYDAILAVRESENKRKIDWPECMLKFLILVGFNPIAIQSSIAAARAIYSLEVRHEFNEAAERLDLPRIFDEDNDV